MEWFADGVEDEALNHPASALSGMKIIIQNNGKN